MDANVSSTQKIVIIIAVLLGILILLLVGYSLYSKAKTAEGNLARQQELDALSQQQTSQSNISITGEAQNSSGVTFENLTNQGENNTQNVSNGQTFGIVSTSTDEEVAATTTATTTPVKTTTVKTTTTVKKPTTTYYNSDRPLTAEEIRRIRQLPIDTSATGNLQNQLEIQSQGQYKAQIP
jgi:flagellar basal body-associated protein FliL